jgi:hypothetical protein
MYDLFALARRLGASSCNHDNLLKTVVIERLPRQSDGLLALVVRKVLRFPVGSLN